MARSDNQKEESPSHWHAQGMHHQQPNGFTRLNATTPNSVPPIHTANRQMPVYGQQSVPYYPQHTYMTPPPMKLVPYGYNRHVVLRMLIGPIDYPIFSYFSAFAMAGVLIYEFVKMNQLTGQIIATSPFNPMIGPSAWVKKCEFFPLFPC
jgi:hypothetical protein